MIRALAILARVSFVIVCGPALIFAEPASPDFRLDGASDLSLRADALYRSDLSPSAGPTSATSNLGSLAPLETLSLAADVNDRGSSYFAARIGPMFFVDDLEDLGTGFTIEGAFGFRPIRFLAIEFQTGYFRGEDDSGSSESDLWGIPFLINAKVCLPLLFLELYGGLGIGGYYIHSSADTGAVDDDEDDFVFGGNAFVGLGVTLGPVLVGLEGKYILTSDVDGPFGSEFTLEAFAAMAVVDVRF